MISAPSRSWPMKVTKPPRSPRVCGLPMSWRRAPKRSARAAGHLVGERLGEQRPRVLGALAGEAVEIGLDLQRLLEHRQRVAVDVEVVVGALLDPAQRRQLGQDDRGHAELVEQLEAAQRVVAAEQQAQLGQLALAGGLGGAAALRPAPAPAVAGSISRSSSAASRAARSSRSGSAAKLPSPTTRRSRRSRSARPPWGSIGSPPSSGTATAPTVKSRSARSASIEPPRRAVSVDLPAGPTIDDPPGGELGGELEGVCRAGGRRRRGRRPGVAVDGEVEVGHLAAQGARRGRRRRRSRPAARRRAPCGRSRRPAQPPRRSSRLLIRPRGAPGRRSRR